MTYEQHWQKTKSLRYEFQNFEKARWRQVAGLNAIEIYMFYTWKNEMMKRQQKTQTIIIGSRFLMLRFGNRELKCIGKQRLGF